MRRKKYKDPLLRKYHRQGFWIKVFSSLAYGIFVIYISRGDSTSLFHPEGYNIYKLILHDPTNIKLLFIEGKDFDQALLADIYNLGYFNEESNYMVTKFVVILSFITFGKFLAINLIFSMIAFTGAWRLYRFFYEQYPQMHRQFAIAILYFPTFVFWSSGILKDPLCIAALGWITYSLYAIFYLKKKNTPLYVGLLLVFGYLLVILKVYIIVSYLPFIVLYLVLQNVNLIRNKFLKLSLVGALIIISMLGFINITNAMKQALGNFAVAGVSQSIKKYQGNYESQANFATSNFSLGTEFDGSMQSLIRMAPAAVVATLFRPYIWEAKKPSTLMSSLESMALMLFTIFVVFKVGVKKFISTIIHKPVVLYCLMFSVMFALFVGATTLNFGSLVRYKIPALPFYLTGLYFILFFNNKLKVKPRQEAEPKGIGLVV